MRVLSALGVAAILWAAIPGWGSPAYACSCVAEPYEARLDRAELIVVGNVTDVRFEGPIDEAIANTPPNAGLPAEGVVGKITIAVEQYLKGSATQALTVEQGHGGVYVYKIADQAELRLEGGPNCHLFGGIPIGERYMLFLTRAASGDYTTNTCSGSAHDFTQESLDRIRQMLSNPSALPETGGRSYLGDSPRILAIALGGAMTTLGMTSLLLTRRQQ
jgi:hypothetical protein